MSKTGGCIYSHTSYKVHVIGLCSAWIQVNYSIIPSTLYSMHGAFKYTMVWFAHTLKYSNVPSTGWSCRCILYWMSGSTLLHGIVPSTEWSLWYIQVLYHRTEYQVWHCTKYQASTSTTCYQLVLGKYSMLA